MKKKTPRYNPIYAVVIIVAVLVAAFNIYAFINTAQTPAAPENDPTLTFTSPPNPSDELPEEPFGPSEQVSPPAAVIDTAVPTVTDETQVHSIYAVAPELVKALDAVASEYNCMAVSLTVFDGKHDLFTYQYGYADKSARRRADADTKFRTAALSELVTAVCTMRLADAGLIDLDSDISDYLGYTVRNPAYRDTPITCRMLMQHTSSLFDSTPYLVSRDRDSARPTREFLDAGSSFMWREPGKQHDYSSLGFAVLGNVCEAVCGKTIDTLARELVFDPMGIDAAYTPINLHKTGNIAVLYDEAHRITRSVQSQLNIGWSPVPGYDHHLAQESLTISAVDYARILAMLSSGGSPLLSGEAAHEIHAAAFTSGAYEQGFAVRFQSGAFLGEDVYWLTGGTNGELTQFIYDAKSGYGVVVFTTGASAAHEPNGMASVSNALTETVWRRVGNNDGLPLEGTVVCIDPGHQGVPNSEPEEMSPGSDITKPKVASGMSGVTTGTHEYMLSLEVGLALRDKLTELGATVIMTRTANNIDISDAERAKLANDNSCDMFIRLHAGGSNDPNVRGYSIHVPGSVYTPDIVQGSARMADLLDSELKNRVTIPSRGIITRDDLAGFNWLTVPGVQIELGYMSNSTDDSTMQTAEFRGAAVDAIAEALVLYRGKR